MIYYDNNIIKTNFIVNKITVRLGVYPVCCVSCI
jgi:hypothetical protein